MSIGQGVDLLSNVRNSLQTNRVGGVMVGVLALIVGSNPGRVKPKLIKLVFVAFPLSTQH